MRHTGFSTRQVGGFIFVLLVSSVIPRQSIAQSPVSLWLDVSESGLNAKAGSERRIVPAAYRILSLDIDRLTQFVLQAPRESAGALKNSPATLSLPLPEGGFADFRIVRSPVMAAGLEKKYPDITTYLAQSVSDKSVTARLDVTPAGFHAIVFSPAGTVYIDPYRTQDREHYIVYTKGDFAASAEKRQGCQVEDNPVWEEKLRGLVAQRNVAIGEDLRTLRLAMAATGEYTAFHGGTKAGALAAIITSVNRVTGIYEREVAVRLVLVDGTDTLIYTDAVTDPYANNDGATMLGQNQTTVDALIGTANYDIGHVFSTGGGGIATLGCVCSNTIKARGVTGLPAPVGDPFDVDYVAHEMGHQFGAPHTFNSISGSCNGNRSASSAYEPGSGTTIMGYAGICGSDNTQSNSNDYFHAVSFGQITALVASTGCAVSTPTGNTAPTVDVSASGGFTIPIGTPFTLTGLGNDADGDALTYCWEQYDLGPAGSPNAPVGNAPLFRSFSPVASPTRTFPRLSDVLNNTQTLGEILPTTTRPLNFRLTVRDNRTGGGGVAVAAASPLNVTADAGPFKVVTPDVPTVWSAGNRQSIKWSVANTNLAPVSCAAVKISLSTDGGQTFPITLAANTDNDGEDSITVPTVETQAARIKVEAVGNLFFNITTRNIAITAQQPPAPSAVWSQGFEEEIFPPVGWLVANPDGQSQTWTRLASPFLFGNAAASITRQSSTLRNDDWLITQRTVVTPKSRLSFWLRRQSAVQIDTLNVWASTGENAVPNFTSALGVYQAPLGVTPPDTTTQRFTVSLAAFAGQQLYLAFQYNDLNKLRVYIDSIAVDTVEVLSAPPNTPAPATFTLSQNYPNPFNPETVIEYALGTASAVRLTVFDVLGREVQTLVNGRQTSGKYSVRFNAANLSSGIYFYKLTASGSSGSQSGSSGSQGGFVETRKMFLVK